MSEFEYKGTKAGKLKLKNVNQNVILKKKKKVKKVIENEYTNIISNEAKKEAKKHGGWWIVDNYDMIPVGNVAFQHISGKYIMALESGMLILNTTFPLEGEGPSLQEIFTLFKVTDTKYALKTFTGKFLSVNARGEIYANSEAMGQREQFDIAMENGKIALQASTAYFLSYNHNCFTASSTIAKSDNEIFILRTNKSYKVKKTTNIDDQIDPKECEINYVKQFQSFGYKKIKINDGHVNELVKAKDDGKFYETMLNRREKMKADRYCK